MERLLNLVSQNQRNCVSIIEIETWLNPETTLDLKADIP